MMPTCAVGDVLYLTRSIPGTHALVGDLVSIIESSPLERGAERRYFVRKCQGPRFWVYESDLSNRDPLA